ncbi:MAG TPA: histidinol dehydrogenase, partial [Firmicutes bacterium]|nr:histidinol dehydrogenase [Bacillota bacterium]
MEFIKGSGLKGKELKKNKELEEAVAAILEDVRSRGDEAVREYTRRFDGGEALFYKIPEEEINRARSQLPRKTLASLRFAAEQIEFFARSQLACISPLECERLPGVTLGHRIIPVASCGAYVPGGRYPLPSSALMSVIPARVAGVRRVVACSPPVKGKGTIHPAVLAALRLAGADEIYCMGGAQAVAAMA